MADDSSDTGPAIAPPLSIVICIAGAVVTVIIVAALYRICRRATAEADKDVEERTWNPNKRNRDQDTYMEEVRWRNNAFAWARAREVRRGRHEYRRGWFREQLEAQGARDEEVGIVGQEFSAERFLREIHDNPYPKLLDQRLGKERRQHVGSSRRGEELQEPQELQELQEHGAATQEENTFDETVSGENSTPPSNAEIEIIINDESDDIADQGLPSNRFPPRSSRMFRTSSIYSGDGLLPSNHLHMIQSQSTCAIGGHGAAANRLEVE